MDDSGQPQWSSADTTLVALCLYTVWAARTGRVLREVPLADITSEELVGFWADDQLEEPYATFPVRL